ncbi:unnamed protein product [Rotaria sp. Silwood2]|nr:unnamed protein product [Rotaria sp. Silwood2]
MGVSNTFGSNVFDLLVGLAVPWFFKTLISGEAVHINSNGLLYDSVLLLGIVIITVMSFHGRKWYLDPFLGTFFLAVYGIFIIFSLLIELNVFGFVNPPMLFNVGDYRRDAVQVYAGKEFFDPDNTEAVAIRNQCAQKALEDMCNFLQNEGEVAIFDATNTTRERRRTIYDYCTETYYFRVFFVESICDSQEVIQANVRVWK